MIQEKICQLKQELGDVQLIAVSKTYPRSAIDEAIQAGQKDFGENKVQELLEKYRENEDIRWHLIGHLQTNKVKYIIDKVAMIHSVDSLRLLETIEKEAAKKNCIVQCLIQVNLAKEETKFGCDEKDVDDLVNFAKQCSHIHLCGFMIIGPHTDDKEQIRTIFKQGHHLCEHYHLEVCSMGMSNDYPIACECGATMVRIGSDIFGKRTY